MHFSEWNHMRIGFDAKRAFLNKTGLGVYSRLLITSICSQANNIRSYLYSPSITNIFVCSNDCKVRFSRLPRIFSGLWRMCYISILAGKDKIEIYHGLSGELPIGLSKTIKKVVSIHDILFERFPEDYPYFDRKIARWKMKYACHVADKIICISRATKEDLILYYQVEPLKIEIVPNIIPKPNIELVSPQTYHHNDYILCVSSFMQRKNQLLLIQAFQEIKDQISHDLILIGYGRAYYKTCQDYVTQHGLTDRIFFLQNISDAELPNWYAHANLMVYPSKYEGFGIPILEALSYDCLVLASDTDIHREISKNQILYFENNNLNELKNQILRILKQVELLKLDQRSNRDSILDDYNSTHVAAKLESIYRELL